MALLEPENFELKIQVMLLSTQQVYNGGSGTGKIQQILLLRMGKIRETQQKLVIENSKIILGGYFQGLLANIQF